MTPFDEDERLEMLAAALGGLNDRIIEVVKDVSDDNIRTLVTKCRREAHPQPGDSHNFEMPSWDLVADLLERELHIRRFFRRAAEHEATTGSTTYCPTCDGDCTPEHIAEMGD